MDDKRVRPRMGKTKRDRMGNADARRMRNRAQRVQWEHDCDFTFSGNNKSVPFPATAANGKRNRHRVAAKGGEARRTRYVLVEDKRKRPDDVRRRAFNRA